MGASYWRVCWLCSLPTQFARITAAENVSTAWENGEVYLASSWHPLPPFLSVPQKSKEMTWSEKELAKHLLDKRRTSATADG